MMASVTSLVQIFHFGSRQEFDLMEALKKKCAKFCKKKISLEFNQFNNSEQLLSNLKSNENNPTIFLVSKALLDPVWRTQYKKDILEFMLKPKTLIVFMNDFSENCIRGYSTQLLQKNVTKRSVSAIFSSTPGDLELYFTDHLLAEVNEKPLVPYCIQNKRLVPVINKPPEVSGNREGGNVRRMRSFIKKLKRKILKR